MIYNKTKLDIDIEIGSKNLLLQSNTGWDGFTDFLGSVWESGKAIFMWPSRQVENEFPEKLRIAQAKDNVAEILENKYYGHEQNFVKNPEAVKDLQCNLAELGYNLGTTGTGHNGVDGSLGELTRKAVDKFETDQKLYRAEQENLNPLKPQRSK